MSSQFAVTEDHIALLENINLVWEDAEFGAPAVDCKRPYGNSSVYYDIAEILGIEKEEDDFTVDQKDYMRNVHQDMWDLLQILIDNYDKKIKVGQIYEKVDRKWELTN